LVLRGPLCGGEGKGEEAGEGKEKGGTGRTWKEMKERGREAEERGREVDSGALLVSA